MSVNAFINGNIYMDKCLQLSHARTTKWRWIKFGTMSIYFEWTTTKSCFCLKKVRFSLYGIKVTSTYNKPKFKRSRHTVKQSYNGNSTCQSTYIHTYIHTNIHIQYLRVCGHRLALALSFLKPQYYSNLLKNVHLQSNS